MQLRLRRRYLCTLCAFTSASSTVSCLSQAGLKLEAGHQQDLFHSVPIHSLPVPFVYVCHVQALWEQHHRSITASEVITPLMQLSALWMLPFSTSAATLGFAPVIRPLHLVAAPCWNSKDVERRSDGIIWLRFGWLFPMFHLDLVVD